MSRSGKNGCVGSGKMEGIRVMSKLVKVTMTAVVYVASDVWETEYGVTATQVRDDVKATLAPSFDDLIRNIDPHSYLYESVDTTVRVSRGY